jgi:malonate-semialdehyde dehydrogenase (acetylating)/methylmalonate-semialdehyde dehydrogenase
MSIERLKNFINGEWVESETNEYLEIRNPALDEPIALCPNSTPAEVDMAVNAAKEAFWDWRLTPAPRRGRCLFRLHAKLEAASDELAKSIAREHGKTYPEAQAEMLRSLEYVEHACAIPELMKGSHSEDVGRGVETYYIRTPLGPFVIIPPFNFPAMIHLYFVWTVASGNTAIVKPSSFCPITMSRIAELAEDCFPKGVLNIIHGRGRDVGTCLITHPDVIGVSLVSSSKTAKFVYELAASHGKRAQCQGGAKNHAFVAEDARLDDIMDNLVSSCFGNVSERCFAISNVLVPEKIYDEFKARFIAAAKALKLGYGLDEGVTMGPVVTRESLERLLNEIDTAIKEGAKLILDGRNPKVEKYPNGYFLAPTIFEAEPGMHVYDEEVFGPVRCLKKVSHLAEAVSLINNHPYGHTSVIYTENGGWARQFALRVDNGQIGINVGTPAPIAFYPVGGRKISFYGDIRGRANEAVDFYTDKKVIISRWHTPFEVWQPPEVLF